MGMGVSLEGRQGWAQSWAILSESPDTSFCSRLYSLSALSSWQPLDMDIKSNRKSFLSRGITGFHSSGRCRKTDYVYLGFVFFPWRTKQIHRRMHTNTQGQITERAPGASAAAHGGCSVSACWGHKWMQGCRGGGWLHTQQPLPPPTSCVTSDKEFLPEPQTMGARDPQPLGPPGATPCPGPHVH